MEQMIQFTIDGVDRGQIPRAQYSAVLIDEGHDFAPEWFKLVVQMVDPATNALLVLYDDAQSIYRGKGKKTGLDFQLRQRRHPGPGPHHHPQAQLPQHA